MRLTELDPRWVGAGGEGIFQPSDRPCSKCNGVGCDECHQTGKEYEPAPERHGVGISFLCPCAECTGKRTGEEDKDFYLRVYVGFANPLDGGPPHDPRPGAQWQRTGETFETLQLSPSILSDKAKGGCGWHGYVGKDVPGEVTTA